METQIKYTLKKYTLEKNTKKYTKTGVGGSKRRDRVNRFGDSGKLNIEKILFQKKRPSEQIWRLGVN